MLGDLLGFVGIAFLVFCAVIPGLWMLLLPERTFTTAAKPRWLGVPFLLVGLYIAWFVLRP